jgi:hypothetical protein
MAITINKVRTELPYTAPSGTGLTPVTMVVACAACGGNDGGDPRRGGSPGTVHVQAPGSANSIAGSDASIPKNVIYYVGSVPMWNGVPLAESGASLDKVSPIWKVTLVQQKRGAVRRTRQITLRLWTSELAVVQILPIGSVNRTTVSARRVTRAVRVNIAPMSVLARRLRAARPGSIVAIRIRVVAADRNGNRSVPKAFVLKVRV